MQVRNELNIHFSSTKWFSFDCVKLSLENYIKRILLHAWPFKMDHVSPISYKGK